MKKILFLILASVLSLNLAFAQKDLNQPKERKETAKNQRAAADWGTFTNFTATDMNGVEHNIQSYLDQGKYVVIDFFCAWCPPCWQLLQSGKMERLYNSCGQGAENGDFVFLMVETETTNTAAQITGTNAGSSYAVNSQGDFTQGGQNPIPIIDATRNYAGNVSIYEGFVPSVYMICPSGYACDVYNTGALNSEAALRAVANRCPVEEDVPIVDINLPDPIRAGESCRLTSTVVSVAPIVSYAWTLEGATPAEVSTSTANVVFEQPGEHQVTLVVTNANGETTETKTVIAVDCSQPVTEYPLLQNFEITIGCWNMISKNTANSVGIVEYNEGMHGFRFSSYNAASNWNQYLISPELSYSGQASLSFKYAVYNQNYVEKFVIMYSTTDSNIESFTNVAGTETTYSSSTFATFNCNIPEGAKYFAIHYLSQDKTYLYIDNITFNAARPTAIESNTLSKVSVFPNPTTGVLNIVADGLTNVEVYDISGRQVMNCGAETSIDITNLEAGVYFVNVATNEGTTVQRIVKE